MSYLQAMIVVNRQHHIDMRYLMSFSDKIYFSMTEVTSQRLFPFFYFPN